MGTGPGAFYARRFKCVCKFEIKLKIYKNTILNLTHVSAVCVVSEAFVSLKDVN